MSPPPILTPASSVGSPPPPLPPQPNSAIPPVSGTAGVAGSSVTPGAVATAAARKRQHPDNEAPARDTKSAGGGVNIVRELAWCGWREWLVAGIVFSRQLASLVDSVLLR